jgi:hypothetical protein
LVFLAHLTFHIPPPINYVMLLLEDQLTQ